VKWDTVNVNVYYPVLLIQGELLKATANSKDVEFQSVDHHMLRRDFVRGTKEIRCIVDVVREPFLGKYLELVEAEIKEIAKRMTQKKKKVAATIRQINEALPDDPTKTPPEGLRAVFEYDGFPI